MRTIKRAGGGQRNKSKWVGRQGGDLSTFTVNRIQASQRGWKGRQSGRPPESRRNWRKEVSEERGGGSWAGCAGSEP